MEEGSSLLSAPQFADDAAEWFDDDELEGWTVVGFYFGDGYVPYDAVLKHKDNPQIKCSTAIVSAGTSDRAVAEEARETTIQASQAGWQEVIPFTKNTIP